MLRRLIVVVVLMLGCFGAAQDARAQSCPGVAPWVFDDVLASDTFCGYITWMAQRGVSLGCSIIDANHRLYCPSDSVNRKAMAAFLFRLGDSLLPSTCGVGQVLKWDGLQWACAADLTGGGGGTVTSVAAGTGLTGGTITSSGTIAADTAYLQRRVVGTCGVGSSIRTINSDGSVVCQADGVGTGTVTSVTATGGGGLATSPGGGISTTGSVGIAPGGVQTAMLANGAVTGAKIAAGTITTDRLVSGQQLPSCLDGQAIRRSGGTWICSNLPSTIATVDGVGTVGDYAAIAIGVDGFPVISYRDGTNSNLKVAKCANASCVGIATLTTVDNLGDTGYFTAIAIGVDGFPVISYYDNTYYDFKVAKCVNAACTGASILTILDSGGVVGYYTSIAIGLDGFPVVSYGDYTNGDVKVAKCTNAACTSATVTTIDGSAFVGYHNAIAIGTDGFPVLSYYDSSNGNLNVAKCINTACTGSATITAQDSVGNVGLYTAIAIGADGFPVVSYIDNTNASLKVAKCINAACTGSSTLTTVYAGANFDTSIAIGTDTLPIVVFYDSVRGHLKMAKCTNAACTGSATITTLDSGGDVGFSNAIAIGADGFPVVSYYDTTNGDLKVVKCSNAACQFP